MLADIDATSLARLRDELESPADVMILEIDITSAADVRRLADLTMRRFGVVDFLGQHRRHLAAFGDGRHER